MILHNFLAEKLQADRKKIALTFGVNLFVGFMPAACKEGFLIPINETLYEDNYTEIVDGRVQVLFRSGDPLASYNMGIHARKVLTGFEMGTLNNDGIRILKCIPSNMPFVYPRGETGLYEASVNFMVTAAYA
ncbi:MAG: minor capsid protein [Vibrio splendidus]